MDQYLIESFREKHREFEAKFNLHDERLKSLEKDSVVKGQQIERVFEMIDDLKSEIKNDINRMENSVMKEARETRDVFREEREWLRQQLKTQADAEEAASTREHTERIEQEQTKRTVWQFIKEILIGLFALFGTVVGGLIAYQEIISAFFK
ncbi:hypothetical protein [Bacteroides graminisolvens]|uniref:hypothetical protein n=1 Tax=Bacteroides graminisolvens TaxID=477666 RepID=UPI002409B8BC|nr:hypothetical protein [Bacteroides graminisolvens]